MTNPLVFHATLDLIGNTPLVLLQGPSEAAGCEIWGKCEYANPGASVKDRAALWIVRDAEAKGLLQPGGTIVEGTAGNTGIGLALVANALGYKTVIVMPETQSREKMDTLRALGAELVLVPAAPFSNPGHFVHTSRRLAEETEGAVWANQFDNVANRKAHIESTAPEIWGKCEYANPGASVKDRAALWIVRDAEAKGLLQPGGTIVEGTAGNTGIGLALVANALGYKTVIVMPETQSREKMDTLRALGAELVLVPAAPFSNPGHFVHTDRKSTRLNSSHERLSRMPSSA